MLTPDRTYTVNGVTIREKLIPDGATYRGTTKLYKGQKPLCGTGKPANVTIHNTGDLPGVCDDGEQYTRATWPNQNMGSSRVHFFVDDTGAWQNLRAGTGLSPADPVGKAEVSWHAGDGASGPGNVQSISIEIIMNESVDHDAKAYDNGARLAAWLLWHHGLTLNDLVTHTYWANRLRGHTYADRDRQSTAQNTGVKWCPYYILGTDAKKAPENWAKFKAAVKGYYDALAAGKEDDDMTREEVERIVKEEVKAAVKEALDEVNPVYKDLADVPPYWQATVSALLRTGAVNGGTPEEVNPTDLNIRLDTLKAAIIAAAYAETLMGKRLPDPPAVTQEE